MGSNHRLKVGIDFGTTFSGVSWAHTSNPKEVNLIREWPGGDRASEKVPSEITYTSTGQVHKWGFEIDPNEPRLMWFKLLLDPTKYGSNNSLTITQTKDLIPSPKKPVDVVTDFLSCLKEHTTMTLARAYSKAFMAVTPIDYCLTVPAIWTEAAKALTLQAAKAAGFGKKNTIRLISEPDAAAAWSLIKDLQPNNLKVDDTFVVVDCGGGTVDLISYTIVEKEPRIVVKEAAVGSGALCGSTFLNQAFEKLLKVRVGEKFEKMGERSRNIALKYFDDTLKRRFSDSNNDYSCPMPNIIDDRAAGISEGFLALTRDDMKKIFDPIIDQILRLVQEQIKMAKGEEGAKKNLISAVLLVGGFGINKYLFKRLTNELNSGKKKRAQIEILQPVNGWSCVARGAVVLGLDGGINISSRRARRHYGVECARSFDFGTDPDERLRFSPLTREPLCTGIMDYYIDLGEQVSEDKPKTFRYVRSVGVNDSMVFTEEVYQCEDKSAPEYLVSSSVKPLCTYTSDMSSVPKHLFIKRERPGLPSYYEIHFEIALTIQSAMLVFHTRFQGKIYGTGKTKYMYEY